MDNQHKQIKGYRDLSQEEINLMNKIKALAEQVGELVDELLQQVEEDYLRDDVEDIDVTYIDAMKWAHEGKKDLQLGFMMLVRAVAKPKSF